jgi:hypothetical protein
VQGSNYVFTTIDRNEDLPFTINQALQNALRGQNFRTIFQNDIPFSLREGRFNNHQQQRQREAEEIQLFRNTLLNQIQQIEQPAQRLESAEL